MKYTNFKIAIFQFLLNEDRLKIMEKRNIHQDNCSIDHNFTESAEVHNNELTRNTFIPRL